MWRPSRQSPQYEYTSSSIETVAQRVSCRGSADKQHKLAVAHHILGGVFGENLSQPTYYSTSEQFESTMALNTKTVEIYELENFFIFFGVLNDGESATKYKLASAEAGTGKLDTKASTEIAAAIFMETTAASGGDENIEALFLGPLGGMSPVCVVSVDVAVATNSCTLANAPISITSVQIKGGTANNAGEINTITPVAASEVQWTPGTKTLNFIASDAVTKATVSYAYLPGNE